MKIKSLLIGALLSISLFSCEKVGAGASGSRNVKYELAGVFSGKLTVVAYNNNGLETIEPGKLPWTLEFTANETVSAITAGVVGTGGKPGEKITYKAFVGGKEVSSAVGTTLSDGIIQINPSPYILKK